MSKNRGGNGWAGKLGQVGTTLESLITACHGLSRTAALCLLKPAEQLKAEQDVTDPAGAWVPEQHGFMGYGVGSVVREAYGQCR